MVRNRKSVLPKGHPRKYTSNGTTQVPQQKRIEQNMALIAKGKQEAKKAAAAAIAEAQAKAAQADAKYDELFSTSRRALLAAGRNSLAMAEGVDMIRKAGDECRKLIVDNQVNGNLSFSATCALTDVYNKCEPIARAATATRPLAQALCELRTTHKRSQ